MILNPVLSGGGINIDDILPYSAHIEFAATAGDNTLHLRTQTAGYDCTIHWGDGSETVVPANGGKVIHNYATAKTYHIFITGKSFAGFYVSNQIGSEKYVAVHSMGKWEVDTATSFDRCFMGCISLTSIPADLFRYNTAVTNFAHCFNGCTSLTTLPADLFRYNTAVTSFTSCFRACIRLTSIPADLFRYNTAVTSFTSCFWNCMSLTSIPADLFRYNTAVTSFSECFNRCTKLPLRSDIFGTAYSTRFSGKTVDFTNCFNRTSFSGTQGTAPALWSFTFGGVTSTGCFGGNGNSAASLSNYSSIPAAWK